MRATSIALEAVRNVRGGTSRALTCALTITLLLCATLGTSLHTVRGVLKEAAEFQRRGGSTWVLQAAGSVSGARCDRLAEQPDVIAAGALRGSPDPLTASALPAAPLPLFSASTGFPEVHTRLASPPKVWPGGGVESTSNQPSRSEQPFPVRGPAITLGSEAGAALGLVRSDTLATARGSITVQDVHPWPNDGRRQGLAYAAVEAVPNDQPFDECWVSVWPATEHMRSVALGALIPGGQDAEREMPSIIQLNSSMGVTFHGEHRLAQAVGAVSVGTLVLGSLALGWMSIRLRRVELASALHAGVPRQAVLAQLWLETVAWVLPAAVSGLALTAVLTWGSPPGDAQSLRTLGFGWICAMVSSVFVGVTCGWAMTRESLLYRFVKTR